MTSSFTSTLGISTFCTCGQSYSFVTTQPIVHQKDQMFIWSQQSGILGTHCGSRRGKSGPQKDTIYAGVATTHDLKAPKGFRRSGGRRGQEGVIKRAGKLVAFDTQDTHGSGRGST
jgi:hypothetical protein